MKNTFDEKAFKAEVNKGVEKFMFSYDVPFPEVENKTECQIANDRLIQKVLINLRAGS